MSKSILKIDVDKLKNKVAINIQKKVENVGNKIIKTASYALFEHIKSLADQELKTRKQFYKNNLDFKESPAFGGYRIILRKPAVWIEKGIDPRNLRESMLSKGQKTRVIPLSDAILTGTNKAKKIVSSAQIKFRTMSINQTASLWNTKGPRGVNFFKKSKEWFTQQLKQGAFSKKK